MKSLLVASLLALTCLVRPASAAIATEADLVTALQTAVKEKNADKLNPLFYYEGMSAEDKDEWSVIPKGLLAGSEIEKITLLPLPKDMPVFFVRKGKKIEQTYPATGMLKVEFKGVPGPMGSVITQSTTLTDAKINGSYYLTALKSTPLPWTGPPDVPISFKVTGPESAIVTIKEKHNSSGVDLEETVSPPSWTTMGQYFSAIMVTSTDPKTDVVLTVTKDGKVVYTSDHLKGAGTIEYKKE